MFNSFLGTVTEKYADSIAFDTGNIEWMIIMSAKSLEALVVGKELRI